jgi:DNA ligase-4
MCKVGSGYSMKELYDLNVHLNKSPLIRPKNGKPPSWLKCGSEKAQVYIEPKNSQLLQVATYLHPSYIFVSLL